MIDILMATYNGGLYLERQILSLLGQTYSNWKLIIHDDGSNDESITVIKKYEKLDSRISLIEDGIKFGNAGKNFIHLLQFSNSKYVIFCDQDDIWLENKLEVLYRKITEGSSSKMIGVYSEGYLYDPSRGGICGIIPTLKPTNLQSALFMNSGLQGCAVLFDSSCREFMLSYKGHLSMHDHLLTITLLNFGTIEYLNDKVMLYRQNHINKVTANVETDQFKMVTNSFLSKNAILDLSHYQLNVDFFDQFKDKILPHNLVLYKEFNKICLSRSVFERLFLVVKNNFTLGNSCLKLCVKILLRPFFGSLK